MPKAYELGFVDGSGMLGPGIYALCQGEVVVYVGQAVCLVKRIYTHDSLYKQKKMGKKPRLNGIKELRVVPFNRVLVFPCDKHQLDELEQMMIVKLNPKYNVHHKPVQGSKSLSELGITLERLGLDLASKPKLAIATKIERRV